MRKLILLAGAFGAISTLALAQTAPSFITQKDTGSLSSNIVGLDVYNGNKDDIGKIKDISLEGGVVNGYVLSVGGFLGMGTHYVIVTPASVKVQYTDGDKKWHATMDATKDQLKAAPEFQYNGKWNASQT